MNRLSPWRAFCCLLATYPTEPTQLACAGWSVLWGLCVGVAPGAAHVFALAPAYDWMRVLPPWVWGLVWAGKGLFQIGAVLRSLQFRFSGERPPAPCLAAGRHACRADVLGSFVLAFGFCHALGLWNLYVLWFACLLAVNAWCLCRAAGRR